MMICLLCSQHPHDKLDKGHLWRRQIRGGVGAMVGRRRLFRCRLASSCKPGSSLLVWNRVFCFFFYRCIEIARPSRFLEKERRENTLSSVRAPCFLHAHETADTISKLKQTWRQVFAADKLEGLWSRSVCYSSWQIVQFLSKTHTLSCFSKMRSTAHKQVAVSMISQSSHSATTKQTLGSSECTGWTKVVDFPTFAAHSSATW